MFSRLKLYFSRPLSLRRYLSILVGALSIFVIYHATVWFSMTSKLLDVPAPYQVGDLARIGYQLPSVHLRVQEDTLAHKHIEFSEWNGQSVDIVTIGDSFSNGGAGGENRYYQDYIASKYKCTVLNINPSLFGENYLEAVTALLKSGLLEEINPKAVLIESVGRYTMGRFAKPIKWDQNMTRDELYNDLKNGKWGDGKPKKEDISFISTANYKLPLYNFYYRFSPNAFDYSNAYKLPLTRPMFNVEAASSLLVFEHDITSINIITPDNVALMNDNFNRLAGLLAAKNIRLVIMIAVDKYDLYHDYVAHNTFGKNPLFDLLRPMEKRYGFIDTKAILQKELSKGMKDIYYADDTHWSHIASDTIVNSEYSLQFMEQ